MNKKRIASLMLSGLLLMGSVLPVGAAGSPKITVGEVRVEQTTGSTITVPVEIEGNPGFAGMDLSISIPDGWQITDIATRTKDAYSIFYAEDEFGDMARITTPVVNPDANGIGKFVTAYGLDNLTGDGVLFWVTYKVPAGTREGLYDVEVTPVKINTLEDTRTNIAGDFTFVDSTGSTPETPAEPIVPNKPDKPNKPTGNLKPTKPTVPEEEETPLFEDIEGNWAEEYILKAGERGLVNGKSEGIFDPDANMTRAEFMTILWRAAGSPAPKSKASFTDLPMEWYQAPIAWAEENKITNGTSPTTFDPEGKVTREQMMTILHRMAGSPVGMESVFAPIKMLQDSESVSSWAWNAVNWSIFQEILSGEQSPQLGKTIAPQAAATRSQIAVSIIRYLDKY